jgi:hypothetical protein
MIYRFYNNARRTSYTATETAQGFQLKRDNAPVKEDRNRYYVYFQTLSAAAAAVAERVAFSEEITYQPAN